MHPVTEADVLGEIRKIAAAQLGLTRHINPEDDLLADLDLDSVDLISLAIGIEERFNIALPDRGSSSLRTIGDLCRVIAANHR